MHLLERLIYLATDVDLLHSTHLTPNDQFKVHSPSHGISQRPVSNLAIWAMSSRVDAFIEFAAFLNDLLVYDQSCEVDSGVPSTVSLYLISTI
jgi:hypothetical protein